MEAILGAATRKEDILMDMGGGEMELRWIVDGFGMKVWSDG
jgi:hypothetical protein